MSEKEKESPKDVGDDIKRIREFGEKKDLPEETINGFIKAELSEEEASVEDWLAQTVAGTADKTTLEQMVSSEGFMEYAGDVIRNMTKGKKPSEFELGNSVKADDTIAKTYANPAWVAQRRLLTGEYTVAQGSVLLGDYAKEIPQVIQMAEANWALNTPVLQALANKAKPYLAFLGGNDWKDPAKIDAFDTKSPALPENYKFKSVSNKFDPQTVKVPALTAEGVVAAARLVLQLRAAAASPKRPFAAVGWEDMFVRKVDRGFSVDKYTSNDPVYQAMEKHYSGDKKTWWRLQYICEEISNFNEGVQYAWSSETRTGLYEIYTYTRALIRLIDASVK